MIAIIDYGLGNVQAFKDVYKRLNKPALIARSSKDLANVSKLILPGVGSFDYAIKKLDESGMREYIEDLVIDKKIPVLGVCVGMQMLAKSSEEGKLNGLGWIDATVKGSSLLMVLFCPTWVGIMLIQSLTTDCTKKQKRI